MQYYTFIKQHKKATEFYTLLCAVLRKSPRTSYKLKINFINRKQYDTYYNSDSNSNYSDFITCT
jgi:hypothetical protein